MILDSIVNKKRKELKRAREEEPIGTLRSKAKSSPPLRSFEAGLKTEGEVSIIAEIKRASPRTGPLLNHLDPGTLARQYEEGSARAISVLTDHEFFHGSFQDLQQARIATTIPLLRKDFIIDDYQIWESRAKGADAILLIARILEPNQLADYIALAREELSIPALVEIHNENELENALDGNASIIGINNRDLDTFDVHLETTLRLRAGIPENKIVVSESGIGSREDILQLEAHKIDAALIGENLVRSENRVEKLQELRGVGNAHTRNPRRD